MLRGLGGIVAIDQGAAIGYAKLDQQGGLMHLVDVIPDADVLLALEPDELGLRMLPVLARWPVRQPLELGEFLRVVLGDGRHTSHYPGDRRFEIQDAIREAWAWLEGAALL